MSTVVQELAKKCAKALLSCTTTVCQCVCLASDESVTVTTRNTAPQYEM